MKNFWNRANRAPQVARFLSWGMTVRMAVKKAKLLVAYDKAMRRKDRRAAMKWIHANTRFDITNVNGSWKQPGATGTGRGKTVWFANGAKKGTEI